MLDWIFEGIVTWVSSVVTQLMDAVSGLFLNALGTEMTAMEEYFPFVAKAFSVMQYTAWAILFLITVWQLFRIFGGPVTDAENPMGADCTKRIVCFADRIRQTYIPDNTANSADTVYSTDGCNDDSRGFHFCRNRECAEKRTDHPCFYCIGRWFAPADYPGNCSWLELLQTVA